MLSGDRGNDSLIGVNPTDASPGTGETDTLTGSSGADIFVLGDASKSFYDDAGTNAIGVALITDFNLSEDIIQLSLKGSYVAGSPPAGFGNGTAIYLDKDGVSGISSQDELISVVASTQSLNLNASYIAYV